MVKRDTTTDLDDEGRRGLQQIKRAQNAREGGGGGEERGRGGGGGGRRGGGGGGDACLNQSLPVLDFQQILKLCDTLQRAAEKPPVSSKTVASHREELCI